MTDVWLVSSTWLMTDDWYLVTDDWLVTGSCPHVSCDSLIGVISCSSSTDTDTTDTDAGPLCINNTVNFTVWNLHGSVLYFRRCSRVPLWMVGPVHVRGQRWQSSPPLNMNTGWMYASIYLILLLLQKGPKELGDLCYHKFINHIQFYHVNRPLGLGSNHGQSSPLLDDCGS